MVLSGQHRGPLINSNQQRTEPSIPCYHLYTDLTHPPTWWQPIPAGQGRPTGRSDRRWLFHSEIPDQPTYSYVAAHRVDPTLRDIAAKNNRPVVPVLVEVVHDDELYVPDKEGDEPVPVPIHEMYVDVSGGEIHGQSENNPCPYNTFANPPERPSGCTDDCLDHGFWTFYTPKKDAIMPPDNNPHNRRRRHR